MRKRIYGYKPGSRSARALAQVTGFKRIKHMGSLFRPRAEDVIINWGNSQLPPEYERCRVINHPGLVGVATDKLKAFEYMDRGEVSIPEFTDCKEVAERWVKRGDTVVCRTTLNGHSGRGIRIATKLEELVPAPLYTLYKKKKSEWRVHIALNDVIFIQQKVRKEDVPDDQVNWQVRNHDNGFVYAHKDREPPACVVEQAGKAMTALDLDFGAVDVIYNEHEGVAYVLEINCAPGLEGTTLDRYAEAFGRL